MTAIHTGSTLGCELLDALGVDKKYVRQVVITCVAGEVATVDICRYVPREKPVTSVADAFQAYQSTLAEVLERYELVRKTEQ